METVPLVPQYSLLAGSAILHWFWRPISIDQVFLSFNFFKANQCWQLLEWKEIKRWLALLTGIVIYTYIRSRVSFFSKMSVYTFETKIRTKQTCLVPQEYLNDRLIFGDAVPQLQQHYTLQSVSWHCFFSCPTQWGLGVAVTSDQATIVFTMRVSFCGMYLPFMVVKNTVVVLGLYCRKGLCIFDSYTTVTPQGSYWRKVYCILLSYRHFLWYSHGINFSFFLWNSSCDRL